MVQDGTRWYKQWYMEVHGGTRQYEIQAGTYWHVLILMIQSGYAALLLDSLLQFCPADSAVLETTASNHTNASAAAAEPQPAPPRAGGRCQTVVNKPALV